VHTNPGSETDSHGEKNHEFSAAGFLLGLSVYVIVGVLWAWNTQWGQPILRKYWWTVLVGFFLIAIVLQLKRIRTAFRQTTAQRRVAVIIFGSVPAILVGMWMLLMLRTAELQVAALRAVFLGIVCCLPAVMYYLFIATKKYSLLNEFIINLDRLGLLTPRHLHTRLVHSGLAKETPDERQKRMLTYVQKFEAVYGAVPTDLGGVFLDPTAPTDRTAGGHMRRIESRAIVFTPETAIPVLIATTLIALGWLITLPPWQGQFRFGDFSAVAAAVVPGAGNAVKAGMDTAEWTSRWVSAFSPVKTPVHFAFMGAYFFSLQILFRRYVRRDLRASAYVAVSQRIILSVIGTWVAVEASALLPVGGEARQIAAGASGAGAENLIVLGFIIGVFPRVAWQVIQAAAKRFTGAATLLPTLHAELPISDLDGLTVWHEARFEEEDIENIPNMATADIVDLLINTRFPPDRLIDWVDQAILYTHIGPAPKDGAAANARVILRAHGIRTASSLIDVYERTLDAKGDSPLEKLLDGSASDTSHKLRSLVACVQTNPNLALIQTWRGITPVEVIARKSIDLNAA
jgi:hypothetical protein